MKVKLHAKKPVNKIGKKPTQKKKKLPLRGKFIRVPGNDKGKVIIKPNFDAPLPEFDL